MMAHHRSHGHMLAKGTDPGRLLAEMAGRDDRRRPRPGRLLPPVRLQRRRPRLHGTVGHGAPDGRRARPGRCAQEGTDRIAIAHLRRRGGEPGRAARVVQPGVAVAGSGGLRLREQPVRHHLAGRPGGRLARSPPGPRPSVSRPPAATAWTRNVVYEATAAAVARARAGEPSFLEVPHLPVRGPPHVRAQGRAALPGSGEVARVARPGPAGSCRPAGSRRRVRRRIDDEVEADWRPRSVRDGQPEAGSGRRAIDYLYCERAAARAGGAARPRNGPAALRSWPSRSSGGIARCHCCHTCEPSTGRSAMRWSAIPAVFVMGEDVHAGAHQHHAGLLSRFGPQRVVETPLSEQGFTDFATGAALAGLAAGGGVPDPVPPAAGLRADREPGEQGVADERRPGQRAGDLPAARRGLAAWPGARQHSDQPYSMFAHYGVKTVLPATPARRLRPDGQRDQGRRPGRGVRPDRGARRPGGRRCPAPCPGPAGRGPGAPRGPATSPCSRSGTSSMTRWRSPTDLEARSRSRCFDPRTLYPFDWDGLAASLKKTGRLVVMDDSNRFCGLRRRDHRHGRGGDAPGRPARPGYPAGQRRGGLHPELDMALQPTREQLTAAIRAVMKGGW